MAHWMNHRVFRLIFAPCAQCLPKVDAANGNRAPSQFDQAPPPLPVSVTPAPLPDDELVEVHEEDVTADEPPEASEALEEPPLTPAQHAPPPAAVAPLTVGPPAAEDPAEDAGIEAASAEHASNDEDPAAQPVAATAAQGGVENMPAQEEVCARYTNDRSCALHSG